MSSINTPQTATVTIENIGSNTQIIDENGKFYYQGSSFAISVNSYIYLFADDRRDKISKEILYWMPSFMSNYAFRFKVVGDCTITGDLLNWDSNLPESTGLISDDVVSSDFLDQLGIPVLHSKCTNRIQYLQYGDYASELTDDSTAALRSYGSGQNVQIVFASGCGSAKVIEDNAMDLLQEMLQGLKNFGLSTGTPVFVHNSRMEIGDVISELVGSTVVCVLMPDWEPRYIKDGVMSAIVTYKSIANRDNPSLYRTYIQNYTGAPPNEFGAQIANFINICFTKQASGKELYDVM